MPAFISYSSVDADFFTSVLNHLDRTATRCDRQCFDPGDDFRDAIVRAMTDSDLFVLLASSHSMTSTWVGFEVNEAQLRLVQGTVKRPLVLIIDRETTYRDLPAWLQRFQVEEAPTAQLAAQMIERALDPPPPPFLGRGTALDEFSRRLSSQSSRTGRYAVLAVSGLEGVGRRSFLERAVADTLSLRSQHYIPLGPGGEPSDIYMPLVTAHQSLPPQQYAEVLGSFQDLGAGEQANEIATLVNLAVDRHKQLPILIDNGALLDDAGDYTPPFLDIFATIQRSHRRSYIGVIHTRRPRMDSGDREGVLHYHLGPLSDEFMADLVLRWCERLGCADALTKRQANTISEMLSGYPPAAYFAARLVASYGAELVVADPRQLVEFGRQRFVPFLQQSKGGLDSVQHEVLRILWQERHTTLAVVACMLGASEDVVAPKLRELIDMCILQQHDNVLSLESPVRFATDVVFGRPNRRDYTQYARRLQQRFWCEGVPVDATAVNSTVHATLLAGKEMDEFRELRLPSSLLGAANDAYNNKEWAMCRDLLLAYGVLRPDHPDARVLLCKALVRLDPDSTDVDAALDWIMGQRLPKRDYIRGFVHWKRGDYKGAVTAFQSGMRDGDHSFALQRDLAECLYRLGRLPQAQDILRPLINTDRPNRYVIDLAARIAIDASDFETAAELVSRLESAGEVDANVAHRKATLLSKQGRLEEALKEAQRACSEEGRPQRVRIEALLQQADILIDLGRTDAAREQLQNIRQGYGGERADVQYGLACKAAYKDGDWQSAEREFRNIKYQHTGVNLQHRLRMATLKGQDATVTLPERQRARKESQEIAERLKEMAANRGVPHWEERDGENA